MQTCKKAAENAAVHLPMAAPFFSMHFAMRPGMPFCKRTRKLGFVARIASRTSRVHSRSCGLVACLPLPLPPTPFAHRFECQTLCFIRRLESAQTVSMGQRSALSAGGSRFCPRFGELKFFDVQSNTNAQPQCTQVPAASVLLQAPLKCLLPSFTIANSDAPDVKANAASRRQARNFVDYPPTHTRLNRVRVSFL